MTDWDVLTLKQAGVSLLDCVHKTPAARETGYPYVGIPQMKDGRINFSEARKISRDDFNEWTKKTHPKKHDVVLSRRTNPGVTAPVRGDDLFALGQNLVLLRADGARVLPQFLRWIVNSPRWWDQIAKFLNVGAVFDSLRCADVPKFELLIPPLKHQKRLTALLSALDDKIELNRQMNETLEASARALFRDWFVDFGPTKAKMAGAVPYLSPDIWPLFPDQMDNDGVPEEWQRGSLELAATLNPEAWSQKTPPGRVTYVDLSNTKWGYIEKTEMYDWENAPSRARRILRHGDAILGTVRPGNGSFAFIAEDGLTGSTGFAVLRPRVERDRTLVWCAATDTANIERLAQLADGGAYPAVRPSAVLESPLSLPTTPELREKFDEITHLLLDRIERNKIENRTLAETRDLLLPKLMSGEIRIRDAENTVSELA